MDFYTVTVMLALPVGILGLVARRLGHELLPLGVQLCLLTILASIYCHERGHHLAALVLLSAPALLAAQAVIGLPLAALVPLIREFLWRKRHLGRLRIGS